MELLQELPSCFSISPATIGIITCLVGVAVPVFLWDLRHNRIPNVVTLTFVMVSGLLVVVTERPRSFVIPMRMICGLLIPLAVRRATGKGVGMGDVHLSCGLAVLLGLRAWGATLLAASILSILFFAVVGKLSDPEAGVPFGPFLMAGAILSTTAPWWQVPHV